MAERYFEHNFPNGLTLLGEHMPGMQSASMTLLVPAGAATDPKGRCGAATVISELALRGAGERNSRQLTDYLDGLGLQRSVNVGVYNTRFGCAALAEHVVQSLGTYADIVQRPILPAGDFDNARDLALQALAGIEDEPRHKLILKLREWHFPSPYGRNSMGEKADIEKLKLDACRRDFRKRYRAHGSILSLAGNIDFARIRDEVEKHFGAWKSGKEDSVKTAAPPGDYRFEPQPSEQTHVGIAYPSISETHDDYYLARLAVEILSGGSSSRLFTEVREKRGLVYAIWAGYASLRTQGSILGYAGTSNERAQATLDCFIDELFRLTDGVTQDELDRAKIGLKAATIMQGESTPSRAGAIAHDYFMRGRIRRLEEIKAAIDGITLEQVNDYLSRNPPGPFTIVIVGPKELKVPTL